MNRKLNFSLLLLWFFLMGSLHSIFALNPQKEISFYKNDIWQIEDGLPQNSVSAIVQTVDGYIWIGTQEGLVRFNGIQFEVFDRDNTSSIISNYITSLVEDRNGILWIGIQGGGVVSFKGGIFHSYTTNEGLLSNDIRTLMVASDGSLWIGTESGLNRLKEGKIEDISLLNSSVSSFHVNAIVEDRSGQIWVGTERHGLMLLKKKDPGFIVSTTVLPEYNVSVILEDDEGNLWIGTVNAGLIQLQGKKKFVYSTKNGLSNNTVQSLFKDKNGYLWIGTRGGGLNRLKKNEISVFNSLHGLSSDIVTSIYEDREGSLWIGTLAGGLNRLKDVKIITYRSVHGLLHEDIRGIFQDSRGNVWIGTEGGINLYKDGLFRSYTTKDGLGSNSIYSICEDLNGNLWFGTYGGGIARFKNGNFKTFTTRDGLSSNIVRCIYGDRKGNIWIGTYGNGLNCFSRNRFIHYKEENGLSHNRVSAILEDSHGNLWIGTVGGGLNRFKNGKFDIFNTKNGFASDIVLSLYEDKEGVLWIGTYAGLSRYKNGRFSLITKKDGLFDHLIYIILEDDNNNFWMSCNRGIFKVKRQDLEDFADGKTQNFEVISFGTDDGMSSIECNGVCQPAGCRTKDGLLWFPTIKGIAVLDPENIWINKVLPPIEIEKITINGKNYAPNNDALVSPGKGNMEISYAGLSFIEPKKLFFKYILEGFEKEWKDARARRTAYYTNIPPGHYIFRVKACNNDDVWNEKGASFELYLKPHIYQTSLFYLFCGLCVLTLGVGGFRLRVKQMKEREKHLSILVDERTQELSNVMHQLEQANKELERLSLTDRLTNISNRRHFEMVLDEEWRRSIREERFLSLIILDIDFFKAYNDTYGHPNGDECLKQVASVIKSSVHRAGDLAARYGGEEFVVILSNTNSEGAVTVSERIRDRLEKLHIPHVNSSVSEHVTISAGIVTSIPNRESSADMLISAADQALYQAKQKGRNFVISTTLQKKN